MSGAEVIGVIGALISGCTKLVEFAQEKISNGDGGEIAIFKSEVENLIAALNTFERNAPDPSTLESRKDIEQALDDGRKSLEEFVSKRGTFGFGPSEKDKQKLQAATENIKGKTENLFRQANLMQGASQLELAREQDTKAKDIENQLAKQAQESAELQGKYSNLWSYLEGLTDQLATMVESGDIPVTAIRKELEKKKNEVQILQKELDNLEHELGETRDLIADNSSKNVSTQITTAGSVADVAEISDSLAGNKNAIKTIQDRIKSLEDALESGNLKSYEKIDTQSELTQLQENLEKEESRIMEDEEIEAKYRVHAETQQEQWKQAETKQKELQDKRTHLAEVVTQKKKQLRGAESDRDLLEKRMIGQIQSTMEKNTQQITEMMEEISDVKSTVEANNEAGTEQYKMFTNLLNETMDKLKTLKVDHDKVREDVKDHTTEISEAKTRMNDINEAAEYAIAGMGAIRGEVFTLKEKVHEAHKEAMKRKEATVEEAAGKRSQPSKESNEE